jgi:hypothetical protein
MVDHYSDYIDGLHRHDPNWISPDHPTDQPQHDLPTDNTIHGDHVTSLSRNISEYVWEPTDNTIHGDHVASLSPTISEYVWTGNHDNIYDIMFQKYLGIHGNPMGELSNFHPQDYQNSCAIATTSMIFKSLEHDLGEDFLSEAFQNVYDPLSGQNLHVYDPLQGTTIEFIDDTINAIANVKHWDIRADEIHGFTVDQLKEMLDSGNRILVSVDGYELYRDNGFTLNEIKGVPDSGHAVQLTGMIESANGSFVVVNDPGLPNGDGVEIPIDRFMNAAADFKHTAIRVLKTEI